jgi:NPCBM/NEW2 domain
VRVTGDDKVLYDRASLRGDGPVQSLDVDVTGIGTLTLSVDFGRGQDVGDRVVWGDPTLVRAAGGPLADEQGKRQK